MGDLAASKAQIHLNFVASFQKLGGRSLLYHDVMFVGLKTDANLFELNIFLFFTAFGRLFFFFVLIFAPVDQFGDRRFSIRRYFR